MIQMMQLLGTVVVSFGICFEPLLMYVLQLPLPHQRSMALHGEVQCLYSMEGTGGGGGEEELSGVMGAPSTRYDMTPYVIPPRTPGMVDTQTQPPPSTGPLEGGPVILDRGVGWIPLNLLPLGKGLGRKEAAQKSLWGLFWGIHMFGLYEACRVGGGGGRG